MTLVELVLDRMRRGAALVVIAESQRDDAGNVICTDINKITLGLTNGAEIGLPPSIFADLAPHINLIKSKSSEDCTFVYVLR